MDTDAMMAFVREYLARTAPREAAGHNAWRHNGAARWEHTLVEQDRARMVEIKAKLRGIRVIERQIEVAPRVDRSAIIVGTYALAIRQGLHFRSRAPLQLGGVRLYALLDEQTRSMQRCLKKGALHVSRNCSRWCSLCGMNFVCRWWPSVRVSNG
jgi:hypothetical protein